MNTPDRLHRAIDRSRLVQTAVQLISVPSRTGEAGPCADRLAELLEADGFRVERPHGGYSSAPAVAVRLDTGRPGRTLQFNGHLDTVHLPFVPPRIDGDRLTGSGSSDMKAGIAAAVEALRALRDADALPGGSVLLTAHDLHESPWGDGSQLDRLIADGYVGDAVLLPEYLNECLPVVGRGGLIWKAVVRRPGPPIHEVMRPNEPSVLGVAAELIRRLQQLHQKVSQKSDVRAGPESVFIGQVHGGEIFNQYPQECRLEGTRRWLPGTRADDVRAELRALFAALAHEAGTTIDATFTMMRDAFLLPEGDPFVSAFQQTYESLTGAPLPVGAKPFCDDGNSFWALAKRPAITHGPRAGGAHTLNEWVSIDDLVRVAHLYARVAVAYCCDNLGPSAASRDD
jgi:acetylornithine deacetylase/succinyl-diaminopimelate desuccinylase-like protein